MSTRNGLTSKRDRLPVPQPDKVDSNLWSFLKNCIGKELSKITMPVQWNEPISFLQRLAEYTHYANILKTASEQTDPETRMLFVATFAVSALASNFERMGKPFNPLLGETYELDHSDFRIVCEQVGHHPPVAAFHADNAGGDFVFHGSMYPKVKFWGKSIEFQPKGTCSVVLPQRGNETYTWSNVNCVVHNIIVGSLWMEQVGTMEIVNHSSKHRCVLAFKPGGWFSGQDDLNIVEGFLMDGNKKKLKFIYGRWTEFLCAVDIASFEAHFNVKADKVDANSLPKHEPMSMGAISRSTVLWQADTRPPDSSRYYNFSSFTMGLNELHPGMESEICLTDSRRRPDIRALEEGDLVKASTEKERLENKQREYRKPYKSKKEGEWWKPRWFRLGKNDCTKEEDWKFVGGYWERKFDSVPDIF